MAEKIEREELEILLIEKLKECKNFEDFKSLFRLVAEQNYWHHIELKGKRRGYHAYAFTQAFNPNKVEYLYDDSKSVGKSLISNLYRVLKYKVW